MSEVWVFNGNRASFPSAVFSSRAKAESWISERKLTGTLTNYPLDVPVYDWVVDGEMWQPKEPHQCEPKFIAAFSSAHQEHYHYEDGRCATG